MNTRFRTDSKLRASACTAMGLLSGMSLSASAWAQSSPAISCTPITVSYAPVAVASVPSMTTWGLIALAAGLGFLAWRQRAGARVMAIALLTGTAIITGSGSDFLRNAYAADLTINLSNPAGGTITQPANGGDWFTITNTSGVPLKLTALTIDNLVAPVQTDCTVGGTIPAGGSCTGGQIDGASYYGGECRFLQDS